MKPTRISPAGIFCDFDGTIIKIDGTDAVLDQFASPAWKSWEASWVAGEISTQECLLRQTELMTVDRETLERFAITLPLDPGILTIAGECKNRGIPLVVLSDGLDVVVKTVLAHHRLQDLAVYANRMVWTQSDRPSLQFPFAQGACSSRAGTCKCALTAVPVALPNAIVYIGDGRSDFCVSGKGHRVFAKGSLQQWCKTEGIPFTPFDNLGEVGNRLFRHEVLTP